MSDSHWMVLGLLCGLFALAWVIGLGFALGRAAGQALWPHIAPRFGHVYLGRFGDPRGRRSRKRWRYALVLGRRVICRVPFVPEPKEPRV